MAGKKQVMDMRSTTSGVSSQESDEQQRNWTKQHWEKKAKDSLSNYDPTRAVSYTHLTLPTNREV